MTTTGKAAVCCVLALSLWCLSGCAEKAQKADENKPISEVKAEAEKMNADQLRQMAKGYQDALAAKKADLDKLAAKLKAIPVTGLMGDEAKKLQADIANFNKSVSALKERFEIYYQKLKDKGGDTSGLQM
jgi:Skp family chaperone for outer membrane proteins